MTAYLRVLVEHQRSWHPGVLRSTQTAADGAVSCLVTWRVLDGETRIDRFPPERVKPRPGGAHPGDAAITLPRRAADLA